MTEPTIAYPTCNRRGYIEAHEGDGLVMARPTKARGTVQNGVAPTLTCMHGCGTGVVTGHLSLSGGHHNCSDGDGMNLAYDSTEIPPEIEEGDAAAMLTPGRAVKRQNGPRFKSDGTSFALTCQDIHGVAMMDHQKLRIRYLTPRECWRLMGQPDSAYDAAVEAGASNAQLYRQAGNSIVVDCLVAIFEGMYLDNTWESGQTTLGDWM